MKCVFERVGPSSKATGWWHYRCIVCGLEGHSPFEAVFVDGREVVIGPACLAGRKEPRPTPLNAGPGTELHKLIAELGITPDASCGCEAMRQKMDAGGVEWCKEHRDEILAHLQTAYKSTDWATYLQAGLRSLGHLGPFTLGGLLDEAIRRAEKAPTRN